MQRRVVRRHASVTVRVALASFAILALLLASSAPALADSGAEAAAREAAARYDARVLDVKTADDQYRVKLLLPSGKVKIVLVPRSIASDEGGDQRRSNGARAESRGMRFSGGW